MKRPPITSFPFIWIEDGAEGFLKLPQLTTAQRDALANVVNGYKIYNSDNNQVESYENGAWRAEGYLALATHTAVLDAHTWSWMEKIRVGRHFPPFPISSGGDFAIVADRIHAMPFAVTRALTIDRLTIEVTTLDAGKIARLGIYEDGVDCYPGALLQDYGTVSVGAAVVVSASADQVLTKGLYWLIIVSDGVPTLRWHTPAWSPLGHYIGAFAWNYPNSRWQLNAVGSGALANPFVAGATTSATGSPAVIPRLKSLD